MKVVKHETAIVDSVRIGDGTTIGPFAHIHPKAVVGKDCIIGSHAVIDDGTVIGDRVTVRSGALICAGVTVEDEVVVGSNVAFNSDALHRATPASGVEPVALVRTGAFIGASASIQPGLTIGLGARIGAASVVTQDVPSHAIVTGNPARIVGYVDVLGVSQDTMSVTGTGTELPKLRARGAKLHSLPLLVDLRGALTFGEIHKHLPFTPLRFFVVYDVPHIEVRGEHAHRELHEFLVCLKGSCSVMLDDGEYRDEVVLDTPTVGLHVPPKVWRVHYKYSADTLTLILASDIYKTDDYIRDYQQFKEFVGRG